MLSNMAASFIQFNLLYCSVAPEESKKQNHMKQLQNIL